MPATPDFWKDGKAILGGLNAEPWFSLGVFADRMEEANQSTLASVTRWIIHWKKSPTMRLKYNPTTGHFPPTVICGPKLMYAWRGTGFWYQGRKAIDDLPPHASGEVWESVHRHPHYYPLHRLSKVRPNKWYATPYEAYYELICFLARQSVRLPLQ